MTDFITEFCSRNSISVADFRSAAKQGWAPAAAFLEDAGVNLAGDDLHLLTEAVHDLRFGAEPEAAPAASVDAAEPQASEMQPEPHQEAQEPQERPDPWASALATINAKPVNMRRA